MSIIKKSADWLKNNLKYHLCDTTAIVAESMPLYAGIVETGFGGMSPANSIHSRIFFTTFGYCGMGWVYGQGRNLWRKLFKISDKTNAKTQNIHDSLYSAAFNFVLTPILLPSPVIGETDWRKIALTTLSATAFGAVNGAPMGYAIEALRDMTGLEECNREYYVKLVKNKNPYIKKTIAAALVAASIALTSAVYKITPPEGRGPLFGILENEKVVSVEKGDLESRAREEKGQMLTCKIVSSMRKLPYKQKDYGFDYWASPKEAEERGGGDCSEIALIGAREAEKLGYRPAILELSDGTNEGHIVPLIIEDSEKGKLYGAADVIHGIILPEYKTIEDLVEAINKKNAEKNSTQKWLRGEIIYLPDRNNFDWQNVHGNTKWIIKYLQNKGELK